MFHLGLFTFNPFGVCVLISYQQNPLVGNVLSLASVNNVLQEALPVFRMNDACASEIDARLGNAFQRRRVVERKSLVQVNHSSRDRSLGTKIASTLRRKFPYHLNANG